jgi:DNA-binding XRE family transcriptional regulator
VLEKGPAGTGPRVNVNRRKKTKRKASRRARTLIDIDALDMLSPGELDIGWLLVPDEIETVTGPKLREFRNVQNWNQEQLASVFRISKDALNTIESSPDPIPDRIVECLDTLRQALATRLLDGQASDARLRAVVGGRRYGRKQAPSKRTIERGRFCDLIIGDIRKIRGLCIDGGQSIVEIQIAHNELAAWKLRETMTEEDRDTFNHPRQWGPVVGYAEKVLGKYFDRHPETIRDWVKAYRAHLRKSLRS